MSKMPDNFVDYVVTSPPYNIGNSVTGNKYNGYSDDLSNYGSFINNVLDQLLRVTKYHIFWNIQMVGDNKCDVMKMIGNYHNKIKDIMIWKKNTIPHICDGVLSSSFEFIIILSNDYSNNKKFDDNNFNGIMPNLITIKNKHHNNYSHIHKAVFPEDIPRIFMQKWGKGNQLWYDPFMGTGTTAVSAHKECKQWIGSEIVKEYCDIAQNRIDSLVNQQTLFNENYV